MTIDTHRTRFLNCHFDNVSYAEVVDIVREHVRSRTPGFMVSLNTDIAVHLENDQEFVAAYNAADLALMDSMPLIRLASMSGITVKERLPGSDLMPRICEVAAREGWNCFFLGGKGDVPVIAARNLSQRYPGLTVCGTFSPEYGFEKTPSGIEEVVQIVRGANPDLLFICLGAPKSEKILYPHLQEFNVPFAFSVGAAIDFAAGTVKRAPLWVQRANLEWFYRFLQEPRRLFKRYFVDSWHIVAIYLRFHRSL